MTSPSAARPAGALRHTVGRAGAGKDKAQRRLPGGSSARAGEAGVVGIKVLLSLREDRITDLLREDKFTELIHPPAGGLPG